MPKRKVFVDKKKSVAFRQLHRSQKDPLIAADGKDLVLAHIDGVGKLSIKEGSSHSEKPLRDVDYDKCKERIKYGIYFDDDYDYLQHLKDANEIYALDGTIEERFRINKDGTTLEAGKDIPSTGSGEKPKLELSSSLFESKGVELCTGLLNQAAPLPGPHPELDPDIVAALDDDDYDFDATENQLEDDFVVKANAHGPPNSENSERKSNFAHPRKLTESDYSDESDLNNGTASESEQEYTSDNGSEYRYNMNNGYDRGLTHALRFARDRFAAIDADEMKSRFTSYSLTSSVIHRSAGLKCVDAVFEKLYEQYDEDEVGELLNEDNEIAGFIKPESQRVQQMIEEYERDLDKEKSNTEELLNSKDTSKINKKSNYASEELEAVYVEEKRKEQWDCESILSTYWTLYNHPTVISEPSRKRSKLVKVDPKTGLPSDVLKQNSLGPILAKLPNRMTGETMDVDNRTSRTKASTIRSRFETPEQRKARKSLIKLERMERRKEKKLNKIAFRTEGLRAKKQELNMKQNLSGIRLA